MVPRPVRRQFGVAVFGLLLVTAGCLGTPSGTGTQTSTGEQSTVPRATYPDPPANLTNSTVEQVTLRYERARLQNHLRETRDLESFSMGYRRQPTATVVNRSDDRVYVRTNATFSWATDRKASDFNPVCSLYRVNQTAITQVRELPCGG